MQQILSQKKIKNATDIPHWEKHSLKKKWFAGNYNGESD